MKSIMHQKLNQRVVDFDPRETAEWVEALDQVLEDAGPDRAVYLLERLMARATTAGAGASCPTEYALRQYHTPRSRSAVPRRPRDGTPHQEPDRWNAMAMVVRQNKYDAGIGGHIST